MNLLNKLTIKNLKLNKKRTIVTIIGIMLSVALITAVAGVYTSGIASLIDFETHEKGNFHVGFLNVPVEEINILKNNRRIEEIFLTKHIGYAKLENSKNEYKPYAHIMAFTKQSLENLSVKLIDGRLPENEDEILIPTHLKTNGRIFLNTGDFITLNVGTRVSNEYELNQFNPFHHEQPEEIINTNSKTYKIVGIIERPDSNIEDYSAPGYTFITKLNEDILNGKYDVYTRYTKKGLEDYHKVTANILGVDEALFEKMNSNNESIDEKEYNEYNKEMEKAKYQLVINTYLISLETNPFEDTYSLGGLGKLVAIVCIIIVFTSVFCIKNSFDISITEKTRQYGMIRSIGATKNQIKKNVFHEATVLGLIGIPLGILSGFIASYILILISNLFLKDMFTEGLKLHFQFSYSAVIFSVILGLITIYLSALKSVRRASKITPIDAINSRTDIKIKSKKIRCPKIIKKIFGIGGEISYKNLKRNKKKYRTTVISMIVSVTVFIALSSFVDTAFDAVKNELNIQEYNIGLFISNKNQELYDKAVETVKFDNIEKYAILNEQDLKIDKSMYSEEYKEKDNYNIDAYINIYSVGDKSYKEYVQKLGLDFEDVKDKAILIDSIQYSNYDENKQKEILTKIRKFSYNKGDEILGTINSTKEQQFKIKIADIADEKPYGLSYTDGAMMIVSDELYNREFKDNSDKESVNIFYKSNNPDKLQDDIEEYLKNYDITINNSAENVRMLENLLTLVAIFLYGFIIVISLIGITNIFNTITTSMELRRQEFAILKSIGMTNKEFNRMIRLESIFMGSKSLVFSISMGIGLSYLIRTTVNEVDIQQLFPVKGIVISVVAVFLLITSLMKYSMGKINKQNIIETIRNENI